MTRAAGRSDGFARVGWASPQYRPTKEKAALDGGPSKHQRKYIDHMHFDAIAGWPQVAPLKPREAPEDCALACRGAGCVSLVPHLALMTTFELASSRAWSIGAAQGYEVAA